MYLRSAKGAHAHKDLTVSALELFAQAINSIMNYMPSCKLKYIFPSVYFSRAHSKTKQNKS